MSETLTEQWKNGTLPLNHYYVKTKSGRYGINNTVLSFDGDEPRTRLEYSDRTEEVLAEVPTYDQFVELTEKANQFSQMAKKVEWLEKQLDIAVKALEVIERMSDKFDNSLGFIEQLDCIKEDCQETLYYLKEIDEVLK